jgi:putative Mn2+ efflux pump MntP
MAVGVSLHSGISDNYTIFLHCGIIAIITFALSLVGVFLGDKIEKLLKGKYQACTIIGGVILICVGAWILISHIIEVIG